MSGLFDPAPLAATLVAHLTTAIPRLEGWCTVEKAIRLAQLVRDVPVPPNRAFTPCAVDLGVFGGRSLLALAVGCLARGHGRAVGIDPYLTSASTEGTNDPANADWWAEIDHLLIYRNAYLGLQEVVDPTWWGLLRLTSLEATALFPPGSINVLHQDTNHCPEVALPEIAAYSSLVAEGGVWVMDDADWPSMRSAREAMEEAGWGVAEDHTGWIVWSR